MALLDDISKFEPQVKKMRIQDDWNIILFDMKGADDFITLGLVMERRKLEELKPDFLELRSDKTGIPEGQKDEDGEEITTGKAIWRDIEEAFEDSDEDTLISVEITWGENQLKDIECYPRLLDSKLDALSDVNEFADCIIVTDDVDIDYLKFFFKL